MNENYEVSIMPEVADDKLLKKILNVMDLIQITLILLKAKMMMLSTL